MAHNRKEIPYFIQIEGCNNCEVREAYTTDSGTFYDEGHAFHAKCIHKGCDKYNYSVEGPFITPQEYIRVGTQLGLSGAFNKAKEIIAKFSDFYDKEGALRPWVIETIAQEKGS